MRKISIEQSIKNASASVEMEGFHIDQQSKEWCKKLLNKEITISQYIELVKEKAGVTA